MRKVRGLIESALEPTEEGAGLVRPNWNFLAGREQGRQQLGFPTGGRVLPELQHRYP